MLKRARLFEIHDLKGCPGVWRDGLTDVMSFFARTFNPYRVVAGRLWEAMRRSGTRDIVDLCSGAGVPALAMQEDLAKAGFPVRVTLTDKYPNLEAFRKRKKEKPEAVDFQETPVDALNVPSHFKGFRTLFASFHHFDPASARRILADALEKRQGIGVFEYTERNLFIWGFALLLTPLYVWIVAPWIRPFRWRLLFWTYLLPVIPLMGVWDGFVSCLRTYSPRELERMTRDLDAPDYVWEIGRIYSIGLPRVTYLIGYPDRAA